MLEIWGAEYQESNALLLRPADAALLQRLGKRERCPVDVVGTITGDRRVRVPVWGSRAGAVAGGAAGGTGPRDGQPGAACDDGLSLGTDS